MKRIILLNDTHDCYHWGCTATSASIRKLLCELADELVPIPYYFTLGFPDAPACLQDFDDPALFKKALENNRPLFEAISAADLVVVNGEGTLHGLRRTSLSLLYLMHTAKKLGTPVHLINQSTYPDDFDSPADSDSLCIYRHVYRNLDVIAFREHYSHQLMSEAGIDGTLSFDCMPLTLERMNIRKSPSREKRLVIGGSASFDLERAADLSRFMQAMRGQGYQITVLIGAKNQPAKDDCSFTDALKQQSFTDWNLCVARSLEEWLHSIASASVLVSGRFHYTIAAAFLEVPCVLMESNTPKNRALAECFGLEPPLSYDSEDFTANLLDRTGRALDRGPVDPAILQTCRERANRNFDAIRRMKAQRSTIARSPFSVKQFADRVGN